MLFIIFLLYTFIMGAIGGLLLTKEANGGKM